MKTEKELPHAELTSVILGCCFEVMNELGPGFQEKVYKNALLIAMRQKGLAVEVERKRLQSNEEWLAKEEPVEESSII